MPITNLNLITVTGKYLLLSGLPASGTVTFTPSEVLTDTVANEIIHPSPFTATLTAQGTIPAGFQLPATNDPDLSPVGWAYTVKETIAGSTQSRQYDIQISYNQAGNTIDLADVVPAAAATAFTTYVQTSGDQTIAGNKIFTSPISFGTNTIKQTGAGLETDNSFTLRKEVTGGTAAPEIILRSKGSDGTFPFWLSGAVDISGNAGAGGVKGRDLVIAAKGDYPATGNVRDHVMVAHGGSEPPVLAVGGWPPDLNFCSSFKIHADNLTKGNLRLQFTTSQTGDQFYVGGPADYAMRILSDGATLFRTSAAEMLRVDTVGGSQFFRISSTGSGQVTSGAALTGLGRGFLSGAAPAASLEIVETTTSTASLAMKTASWGAFNIACIGTTPGTTTLGTNGRNVPLVFSQNSQTRIQFGTGGQIGFFGAAGTTQPTGIADVTGGITADAEARAALNSLINKLEGLGLLAVA